MSRNDVRPTAMRAFEEEDRVDSALSKSERRVKIDMNDTWMIRFLPVQMGKEKQFYVRLAQHWWNKSPIYCPRHLPVSWGGDPDFQCPVCAVAERLQESNSEDLRDLGYAARVQLRRKMWCIVYDKEDSRGRVDEQPIEEILNPYSFEMSKTTWQDFKKLQGWAINRRRDNTGSDLGLLDLETGCNLLASHTSKGIRLDKHEPGPIFDLKSPEYQDYIDQIFERIRTPNIIIPKENQLIQLALKIEEASEGGTRRRTQRSRRGDDDDRGGRRSFRGQRDEDDADNDNDGWRSRKSRSDDDDRGGYRRSRDEQDQEPRGRRSDDAEDDRPRRSRQDEDDRDSRRSEAEPASRRRDVDDDDRAEDNGRRGAPSRRPNEDREPEDDVRQSDRQTPPGRRTTDGPPSARRGERDDSRDDARDEDRGNRRSPRESQRQVDSEELDRDQEPKTSRRVNAPPPPSARQTANAAGEDNDDDGDLGPQRKPTENSSESETAQSHKTGGQSSIDEEEDNVPEENKDHAPAQREAVDEAPPEVTATGSAAKRTSASDLQRRLDRLGARKH